MSLTLVIFLCCFFILGKSIDYTETKAIKQVYQANNPYGFPITLDIEAFQIDVTPKLNSDTKGPRCSASVSTPVVIDFNPQSVYYTGFSSDRDQEIDIEYTSNKNTYFLSLSTKFGFYATDGYSNIVLSTANAASVPTGNTRVFMILDTTNNYIYQISKANAFSYKLADFFAATATIGVLPTPAPIPEITIVARTAPFTPYTDLYAVKYDQQKIYIVANGIVEVYSPDAFGNLDTTAPILLDAAFLGVTGAYIVDIAFKGNYLFLLDRVLGVFVVDISTPTVTPPHPFHHETALRTASERGKFIAVSGPTLIVIAETTSVIHEYFIEGAPTITKITLNRYLPAVNGNRLTRRIYMDENYLYVMTTNSDVYLMKHSIPERFGDLVSQDGTLLSLQGMRLISSGPGNPGNGISKIFGVFYSSASLMDIAPSKSKLSCLANDLPACAYVVNVQGLQQTCSAKPGNDPNSICKISQKIIIKIVNEAAPCPPTSMVVAPGTMNSPTTPTTVSGLVIGNVGNSGNNGNSGSSSSGGNNNSKNKGNSNSSNGNEGSTNSAESGNKGNNMTLNDSLNNTTQNESLADSSPTNRAQDESLVLSREEEEEIDNPEEDKKVMIMLIVVFATIFIVLLIFVGGIVVWLRKERKVQIEDDPVINNEPKLENIIQNVIMKKEPDNFRFIEPQSRNMGQDDSRIDFGNDLHNRSVLKTID